MRPMIVAALRSPIGTAGHALAGVDVTGLAAPVLARVAEQAADLGRPDEVVLGNCMGPGGDPARVAALAALGADVPAVSVDRQCGSGLAAIEIGAGLVHAGAGLVLAGGVESASTAPWRMWPPSTGEQPRRYLRAPFAPAGFADPDMGLAADELAASRGVDRCAQDEYAARSHRRAWRTASTGGFADEIVPVAGLERDERPRPGMSAARLARLPATYREAGTVTAGNSCGINDGAAVVALVPDEAGVPGLRILATASAGVDPALPGIGLVPAVRKALYRAGVGLADIDVIEFNEAFAGQVLACCRDLDLDPERVCPEGGALALGHPWGASGAVLAVRLFTQMIRRGTGRLGLAAIAIGGGQGVAMVVEASR
jgi:acetyl-CoA C-acetyltransferase